jgi:hypothetical protein
MAIRLREYVFGNWRNQGVALFFAVTIWYVAYKSETQSEAIPVRLVLIARPEGQVIIRQECFDSKQEPVPFDRTVVLSVTGPRKQIEKLRGEGNVRDVRFPVDAGVDPESRRKKVELTGAAFAAIAPGVKITTITPEAIFLTFDTAEEREFPVEPIYQLLPEGMETEPPKIEPSAVPLYGPRSLLKEVKVTAEPRLGWDERFDDTVALNLRYPDTLDKALVEKEIHFVGPTRVRLSVRLRYKNDFLDADAVRVRFLIPAARFPFQVQFPDDGIAVRFQGPLQEIRRLRERVKSPDFALAVTVPSPGVAAEQTIPFTEDGLLLYGASDRVQIRQHPLRQAQGKGAWTYSLVPVPVPSPADEK